MRRRVAFASGAMALVLAAFLIPWSPGVPPEPVDLTTEPQPETAREPAELEADPREPAAEDAPSSDEVPSAQGIAAHRGEYGSVDKTLEEVYSEISRMILIWAKDEAEFHRRNLGWKVDDQKWSSTIPFTQLAADDFQLDTQALEAANSVAADYEERLRQASATAWELLNHYADVYARQHAEKRPSSESDTLSRSVAWDGPPENEPRYSTHFGIPAGKWVFEVYFSSTDFPELQRALIEVEDIQKEREQAVRRVLR